MAKVLDMPKLSPTMEEGVLSAWHKKEGDAVAVDDLLAEVETDKATMEFRAFDAGTLLKILVPPGALVKLGQPVAIVGAAGEDVTSLLPQAGPGSTASAPAARSIEAVAPPSSPPKPASSVGGTEVDSKAEPVQALAADAPPRPPVVNALERTSYAPERATAGRSEGGRVMASPYVRKVAREIGLDLQGAQGTGPGGRLSPADLESMRHAAATSLSSPAPLARLAQAVTVGTLLAEPEVRPLSPMRKTIARRLSEAKRDIPHFYLSIDVDVSELVKLRARINAELASPGDGKDGGEGTTVKISLNDLLVKACAGALLRVPECNASFTPEAILVHRRVDISVAVAVPDGLLTPVVRHADQKSVVAIAGEVRELAGRARARKLRPDEMQDGTFSISNLGMFGVDQFSAVINPPEGAILAVGQVRAVPVVADGVVVPGQRMALTLSCDHRVVDGAIGAAFLSELRRLIEHPLRVLTG